LQHLLSVYIYNAIVIKAAWHWKKTGTSVSETKLPKANTCIYRQVMLNKVPKNTLEKRQPLQYMVLEKLNIRRGRLKLDNSL
jgi:hypothetical protein